MYYFINYLRTIATILITNSHYSNIWPVSAMATGGLLGNILFFAASGFCLCNVKENFGKWYLKRFLRVYPVMVVFTLLTVLLGFYPLANWKDAVYLFLYPTNYIFLFWLMILYVPFYIVAWLSKRYKNFFEITLAIILVSWLMVYALFINKSVYHIDNVEKPFIMFLYFASMLIGGLFKKYFTYYQTQKKKTAIWNFVLLFLSTGIYFASKIAFSKWQKIAPLQILNQVSILFVLYFVFAVAIRLENRLKRWNTKVNAVFKYFANITLQIYIVQFVILRQWQGLVFPLDFAVVTCAILLAASALYFSEYFIRKGIFAVGQKIKNQRESRREKEQNAND